MLKAPSNQNGMGDAPTAPAEGVPSKPNPGQFKLGAPRPPRRKPGGVKGNVSAAKKKNVGRLLTSRGVERGVRALVAAGKLGEWALALLPLLRWYDAEAAAHCGGEPSFVEQRHIANGKQASGIALVLYQQVAQEGFHVKGADGLSRPHPLLDSVLRFVNAETAALDKLPRERRSKPALDLRQLLAQRAASSSSVAAAQSTAAPAPDSPSVVEIATPGASSEGAA